MSAKVYTTPLQNLYEGTRPGGAVVVLYHDYTLLEGRIRELADDLLEARERIRSLEQEVNQAAGSSVYYEGSHCRHGVHSAKVCPKCSPASGEAKP